MKILIVCASNICRSPYVEYLMKREIALRPKLKDKVEWVKSSAVMNKMRTIHPKARMSLMKEGFSEEEINYHKPSYIWTDYRLFKEADVIIGMTYFQRVFLPFWLKKKFITLSEAAGLGYIKIKDPFLKSTQESYDKVMDELKDYLNRYLDILTNQIS